MTLRQEDKANAPADCVLQFPRKTWRLRQTAPPTDPAIAAELARMLGTSAVVGTILAARGFRADDDVSIAAARRFLQPKLADLHEPVGISGLLPAAKRLAKAIGDGERIAIYGDYDVDGITATAILWHTFTLLGAAETSLMTYIPHRVDEGYGLNSEAIDKLADDGARVIVSVDCGITAVEQALRARERGMDLIITDHHEWREGEAGPTLPEAFALVHPRLPGHEAYGNPDLTGAGVAFKLAWEVGKQVSGKERVSEELRSFLVEAMALAALGTIADVAPLLGENRILARYGLGGLKHTKLRGLRALIESAGLNGKEIDSYHVGFLLGPRLNACGRMGHAELAVEMLTTAGPGRAREIADFLECQNRQRQATEKSIVEAAVEQVQDRGWDSPDWPAIVVDGEGWHVGVVGIVASRLVDRFHKPAVVLATDNGTCGGSARSIMGFHLAQALAECDDLLAGHGGHAMAAGLRLETANIDRFRERFVGVARQRLKPEDLVAGMSVDAEVSLGQVSETLVKELDRLGPFGPGNPRPVLVLRGLTVLTARACGKTGDHLQLLLDDGQRRMKGIAFGCGKLALQLKGGDKLDVAAVPQLNEWNGRVSVELQIKDLARVR